MDSRILVAQELIKFLGSNDFTYIVEKNDVFIIENAMLSSPILMKIGFSGSDYNKGYFSLVLYKEHNNLTMKKVSGWMDDPKNKVGEILKGSHLMTNFSQKAAIVDLRKSA